MDWGAVPDWIGAIGGSVALLITIRLYGRQRDQLTVELDSHRREQAQTIAAWTGPPAEGAEGLTLHVRNGSDQPAYNFLVLAYDPEGKVMCLVARTPLPPGHHEEMPLTRPLQESRSGDGVTIEFDDAAGRSWRRGTDGRLREIAPEERRWDAHAPS